MKLIDKDALVAEIRKEIKSIYAGREYVGIPSWEEREIDGLEKAMEILNTLEVKEVEEPNASDRGMAEEIIINLKRVEQDYRIDLTKEIEWLRNKVKKGE